MKTLWAPWRMTYIKKGPAASRCIFCTKPRARRDAGNLILHRGRHAFILMNLYPYNSGHVMVAPYAHVDSLERLSPDQALDLLALTNLALRVLRETLRPQGFNLGINLGRVSGAGIEGHVHLHIVPRWNGDTNFMPLFAETRVMPEHLRETYRKLRVRVGGMLDRTVPKRRSRRPSAGRARRRHAPRAATKARRARREAIPDG